MAIKLVCFDVDRTLTYEASWTQLTAGLGIAPEKNLKIYKDAFEGRITFREGEEILKDLYISSGKATKENISRIFEGIDIRPEAYAVIDYLKKKSYPIYLISGAVDTYVEIVANKVGATGYYSNSSFEYDTEGIISKINYIDDQGFLKLEQVKELMKKYSLKNNEIAFVGDGTNDIEVFKFTRHGIAVYSTEEKLIQAAWKVIDSLEEIKDIL